MRKQPRKGPRGPGSGALWYDRDRVTGRAIACGALRSPHAGFLPTVQIITQAQSLAHAYLSGLASHLGIPVFWLDDLDPIGTPPANRPVLQWLGFDGGDPRSSFVVERVTPLDRSGRKEVRDVELVIIATLHWPGKRRGSAPQPLYGGQGVRVVLKWDAPLPPAQNGSLRCIGASSSLPRGDDASVWRALLTDSAVADVFGAPFRALLLDRAGLPANENLIGQLGIRFVRRDDEPTTAPLPEVVARTLPRTGSGQDVRSWALESLLVVPPRGTAGVKLEHVSRRPVFTHADSDALVYGQDPLTRSGKGVRSKMAPNRETKKLDPGRARTRLRDVQPAGAGTEVDLTDGNFVTVMQSRFVDAAVAGYDENKPKRVASDVKESVRTNTFGAVDAYLRVSDVFARLARYGFAPATYFRAADLPLVVRYRSGITPGAGRDGNTINAQVTWNWRPQPLAGTFVKGALEVRFALGDLDLNPRRWPLSIASDPRWSWHEMGHVLLAAATGELEFRFAHSPGDSLAAILSDPDSALASDSRWRGVTFPWVSIPARRHDRHARDGWSWTGSLYLRERFYAGMNGRHALDRNGYWAEQILSSSLFRLYRALGGDMEQAGAPDGVARQRAAEYAVYLVVHAIYLLGSASASVATRAEDFVDSMIAADQATTAIDIGNGRLQRGYLAHKVVRWAFERQGLYADTSSGLPQNHPGLPPDVDVYIEDMRPNSNGQYRPVDFHGTAWHAHAGSLWVRHKKDNGLGDQPVSAGASNFVYLRARNRGRSVANQTQMRVWAAEVGKAGVGDAGLLDWPSAVWKPLNAVAGDIANVKPGRKPTRFGPFEWVQPKANTRYALLAAAHCDDDRANTEPPPGNTSVAPAPTTDVARLVAWDNNLALRVIDVA